MALRCLVSRGHCNSKSIIVSLCSLTNYHHQHLRCYSPSPARKFNFPSDLNKRLLDLRTPLDFPPRSHGLICGGSSTVKRAQTNPQVQMCAKFAVEQINLKEGLDLQLSRVIGAESGMVSGRMYDITLQVMDGSERKFYFAKVHYRSFVEQQEKRLSLKHWYEWKPSPKTIKNIDAKRGNMLAPPHNIDLLKDNIPTEDLLGGRRAILKQFESVLGVQACARFAVDTMNSKEKLNLQFLRVVNSTSVRYPEGETYDINLEAKDGRKRKLYSARVHDDLAPAIRNHRELVNWYEWPPTPKTQKTLNANKAKKKHASNGDSPDEDVKAFQCDQSC